MQRLIDADALIEKLEKELEVEPSKSIQTSLIKSVCLLFCKAIELQPTVDLRKVTQDYVSDTTIDAVPVIRCKDCAHWDSDDGVKGYCNGFNLVYRKYDADYYCATAEREPDEH